MARLPFEKYQGLGNDFLVVDAADPAGLTPAQAQRLCDRHFGVGADGVLVVTPEPQPEPLPPGASPAPPGVGPARARMVVLNADGSRPEMCGNGLRCVALHLVRTGRALGPAFTVATDAGPRACVVTGGSEAAEVRLSLGRGRVTGERAAGTPPVAFTLVDMGNPHAITFAEALDARRLDDIGPGLSAAIPGGTNVEFARLTGPAALELLVWERGVGRTLACGTGAGATVMAGVAAGLLPRGAPVSVRLPGGVLAIEVAPDDEVWLQGPARHVFSGAVELA